MMQVYGWILILLSTVTIYLKIEKFQRWYFIFCGVVAALLLLPLGKAPDPYSAHAADILFFTAGFSVSIFSLTWGVMWKVVTQAKKVTPNLVIMMMLAGLGALLMSSSMRSDAVVAFIVGRYVHITALTADLAVIAVQKGLLFGTSGGLFLSFILVRLIAWFSRFVPKKWQQKLSFTS
jgi:hypothetical protein